MSHKPGIRNLPWPSTRLRPARRLEAAGFCDRCDVVPGNEDRHVTLGAAGLRVDHRDVRDGEILSLRQSSAHQESKSAEGGFQAG